MNDCRKAVNQAIFRPTAERKAHAIALLKAMMEAVTNLEEVKPTKTKAKAKRKATKRTPCLLYTSPSPRDAHESRMPSSA